MGMVLNPIETVWGGYELVLSISDQWWAFVNKVMDSPVPKNLGNFLTSWTTVHFSRWTLLSEIE
jgi:hypothetical protein